MLFGTADMILLTNQLIKPLCKECRLARLIEGVKNAQDSMGLGGLIHAFSAIERTRVPEIPARMLHKLLFEVLLCCIYCTQAGHAINYYVAFTAFKQVMRSIDMASFCIQADMQV